MAMYAALVFLVIVCVALGQWPQRNQPANMQSRCYDSDGNRVAPGDSYFDGCNTCTCPTFGRPPICTMRACIDPVTVRPHIPTRPTIGPIHHPFRPMTLMPIWTRPTIGPILRPFRPIRTRPTIGPIRRFPNWRRRVWMG